MIKSYACKKTRRLFEKSEADRQFRAFGRKAMMKLTIIHAATMLKDLRSPPGNRLELLKGDRAGQHSIRINDQWRVCFRWHEGDAYDVEICD